MLFIKEKNIYKVIKITGPKHNLLGLSFCGNIDKNNIEIIELPISTNEKQQISSSVIKAQVCAGIEEINAKSINKYKIDKIYFIPSDSFSEVVYKELTIEIIKRLEQSDKFNS